MMNWLMQRGFRLALVPVLALVAVGSLVATPRSAEAATVGNCVTVSDLNGTAYGKIRWTGMAQCFAINLKSGYSYTFTTEVGDPSEAYSASIYSMLGDSTMQLWAQKDGVFIEPGYDALRFNLIALNDDYNAPTTYASQITYTPPGAFGEERLHIIRVAGYGSAVGRYSVTASEWLQIAQPPCQVFYGC